MSLFLLRFLQKIPDLSGVECKDAIRYRSKSTSTIKP